MTSESERDRLRSTMAGAPLEVAEGVSGYMVTPIVFARGMAVKRESKPNWGPDPRDQRVIASSVAERRLPIMPHIVPLLVAGYQRSFQVAM